MSVEIRRGSARFAERAPGRLTRHSFSFGEHYDAGRLGFGPIVCHDDHLLGPGVGFDAHRHSGLDIVTRVVSGSLRHTGPDGVHVLPAGSTAVLRTGDGVEHAEHATDDGPCRFVQVWLRSDDLGEPRYDVAPPGSGPVHLDQGRFEVRRLGAGETTALPGAARVHAYLATGALLRSSLAEPLEAGDAFEMTDESAHDVTAAVPTDLLVWSLS